MGRHYTLTGSSAFLHSGHPRQRFFALPLTSELDTLYGSNANPHSATQSGGSHLLSKTKKTAPLTRKGVDAKGINLAWQRRVCLWQKSFATPLVSELPDDFVQVRTPIYCVEGGSRTLYPRQKNSTPRKEGWRYS